MNEIETFYVNFTFFIFILVCVAFIVHIKTKSLDKNSNKSATSESTDSPDGVPQGIIPIMSFM
jgi:hypothetical protein